eukprot:CAMPEP_0202461942 /NCGR_PEP_ID=MMETSP1360-20130828/51764_1 /ASSEMBLY_ACC=CAM_ASM_000848 /TAXON_ID=515479 /ORGANISM="Licmophora paradoxa, Strain CCMP2313" /LENGTH=165 /DNA_ID=CAMNT_0049084215 /DNA_START=89 /DNA_END=583 /DNA_ORIENTATION=-
MSEPNTGIVFPKAILTPIRGKPTITTVKTLTKELYANAASIYSTRGGGTSGHLSLMMNATTYLTRTSIAFDEPIHPGAGPTHAANATGPQITETNRLYSARLKEHERYHHTLLSLKAQILAALEPKYLAILEDDVMGFADVKPIDMLEHLKSEYGEKKLARSERP